jgi:hypothetical protein
MADFQSDGLKYGCYQHFSHCYQSMTKEHNAELYALHIIRPDVDLFGPHETPEHIIKMKTEGEEYLKKSPFPDYSTDIHYQYYDPRDQYYNSADT